MFGKITRLMRKDAGLPTENATVQHHVELACLVREIPPRNLTLTEAGVPGRIPPGKEKKAVSVGRENVTILLSVELDSPVREIQLGNLWNVLQLMEVGVSGQPGLPVTRSVEEESRGE